MLQDGIYLLLRQIPKFATSQNSNELEESTERLIKTMAAEQVEGLFKNYGSSGFLVVMTVGAEELAAFLIFECPCNLENSDFNFVYGMSYLLGPAIILFLVGLAYQVNHRPICCQET